MARQAVSLSMLFNIVALAGIAGCTQSASDNGAVTNADHVARKPAAASIKNEERSMSARKQLFESIITRQGATLLPGHYGGDANSDQLAIAQSEKAVTLVLGLKVLDATGGLHLSTSPEGYVQYSKPWLEHLVQQLNHDSSTKAAGAAILRALQSDTLVAGVACLDINTQQVRMLRIAIR